MYRTWVILFWIIQEWKGEKSRKLALKVEAEYMDHFLPHRNSSQFIQSLFILHSLHLNNCYLQVQKLKGILQHSDCLSPSRVLHPLGLLLAFDKVTQFPNFRLCKNPRWSSKLKRIRQEWAVIACSDCREASVTGTHPDSCFFSLFSFLFLLWACRVTQKPE